MLSPSQASDLARSPRPGETGGISGGSPGPLPNGDKDVPKAVIEARAYSKWLLNGRPSGTALRDWLEAEAEIHEVRELARRLADANALLSQFLAESKRREEELARAEERYRGIFDNAVEGIFQTTRDGRFLAANPALARMLGYGSPAELMAAIQSIGQQLHVDPHRRDELQRLLEERGAVHGFECQIRGKEGNTLWIALTARAVRDAGGALLYFEGRVENISERKQTAEALRNSEVLYHSLVDTLPVCIVRKDLSGRFIFGNRAFCESLHRPLSAVAGKTDYDFYPAQLAAKYLADDRRVIETREVLEAIEEHQKPDGERTYVRVLKAPLYDSKGAVIGVQGVFWDITARKRAEAELARTEAEFRVARGIQQKLFPTCTPNLPGLEIGVGSYGFDISGASFPAEAIGGDYYDFVPLADGSLGIAIGDVSGHGVGPALLMAEARALLRAFAHTQTDVSTILGLVNRVLVPDVESDRFITLLLAKLDPRSGALVYASAGHQTGYLLDAHGNVKQTLPSTGIPLGIRSDADFPASEPISLHGGDFVLLVTDGVVEARSPDGAVFGLQRSVNMVRIYRHATARQIVDNLYHAVRAFSRDRPQYDDITATVIKVGLDKQADDRPPSAAPMTRSEGAAP
jgi:PAS domain S-box-containing protein